MPSGDSAWHYVETHRGSDHPRVPNLKTSATELFKRRYHNLLSFASNLSATNSPETVFLLLAPLLPSGTNECSYRNAPLQTLPSTLQILPFRPLPGCKLFQTQRYCVNLTSANVYCPGNPGKFSTWIPAARIISWPPSKAASVWPQASFLSCWGPS